MTTAWSRRAIRRRVDLPATETLRARLRANRPKTARRGVDAGRMTLRVGIDIGGTFTDLVAIDGAGRVFTRKVLSTPADYAEGIGAALEALRTEASDTIAELLHATTIGSNTILEGDRRAHRVDHHRGFSRRAGDPRSADAPAL